MPAATCRLAAEPVAPARPRHRIDLAIRNRIVEEHLGLVYLVIRRMPGRVRRSVPRGELVTAGAIGLIQAAETFDASRGLAFSSFALPRIRGAILDEIRREDPAPRSLREKQKRLACAREAAARGMGEGARRPDVARELGTDLSTLWRWEMEVESARPVPIPAGEPGPFTFRALPSLSHESIEEAVERGSEREWLLRVVEELEPRSRDVVRMRFFEERPIAEIAARLGVSDSRASQICGSAIRRLRELLVEADFAS